MASLNTDHAPADSHKENDPRDTTTLANRAAAEKAREKAEEEAENAPQPLATEAALSHGNEPSKGAKIDASLQLEEEAELKKKEEAKAQSAAAKKH